MSAVSFEDEDDEDEAVAAVDVDRSLEVQRRREEEEQEEESEDDEGGDEPFVQEMLGSSGSRGAIAGTSKPDINSELALGYKSGRSFVVRGNQIGWPPKGKIFTPKKVMLHDNDRALVMMNPDQGSATIFTM
ncbi:hypothetical protein CF328_g5813 [Tilletia controversa]|nr:hypothetical protein CF328_g5813 [Tilletia controversa]